MALTMDSLNSIPTCFASCSIGYSSEHTLPKKLNAIHSAGFNAIELSMPDIVSFASMHLRHEVGPKDFNDLVTAARVIKSMCDAKGLKILILQPFSNYEGWPEGSEEKKEAWERVEGWVRIMEACGTDMLQVGSSDSPSSKITTSRDAIVQDLQKLADHLASKSFRIAYENWCWSTHAPLWTDVWDICQRVNRPNFGLCLDTFQSAGGEWGDPTTPSGLLEKFNGDKEAADKAFRASCEKLSQTVPKEKIYFLQVSDAYKPKEPLSKEDGEQGLRPRGRWSHDFRPMPYDGGYLPVVAFTKAVLKTGFRGYLSYEIFDSGPEGKGKEYDLEEFAKKAMESYKRLLKECADGS